MKPASKRPVGRPRHFEGFRLSLLLAMVRSGSGLSIRKMAARYDCSESTIRRALKRAGNRKPPKPM